MNVKLVLGITFREILNKNSYANDTNFGTELGSLKETLDYILSKIEKLASTNKELQKSVSYC